MGYIVVAVVAVAVAVFAMQNTTHVVVKFLIWDVADVPVAAVVLVSFGVGILAVGIPASFKLWRLRRRLRAQASGSPHEVEVHRPAPPDLR
ncbi:MAG TPA: lipopolysaccharide assembly protein LapA domain-containing protein [Methylomirabilota bacterium]|jgi:uncharacterized integral membrane protein